MLALRPLRQTYCEGYLAYLRELLYRSLSVGTKIAPITFIIHLETRMESDVIAGNLDAVDFKNFWDYQLLHDKLQVVNTLIQKETSVGRLERDGHQFKRIL